MTKYEFIKVGKRYMVKNSNGRIVSEKEKIEMENKQLILEDITGCNCQKETTKKLTKNKKRLEEIKKEELVLDKDSVKLSPEETTEPEAIITVLEKEESTDDTIKETDTTI